jgi:hypothetical protein
MRIVAVLLLALLALIVGCSDDPTSPPPGETQSFLPLTTRNAVLNNLELGWTQRKADKIDELLDDNFIFFFNEGDVGGEIPESWSRFEDLAATTALLESNTNPPSGVPVCREVRVDLVFDDDLEWTEVPVPATAVGEVWYTATVPYLFQFEMEGDLTFVQNDAKAQFTVRQDEAAWRLVEWRDLGESIRAAGDVSVASTEANTWGGVKALYR